MKLQLVNLMKKIGPAASVYGFLLCLFTGIIYEDLRQDLPSMAQALKTTYFWMVVLGVVIMLVGMIMTYITYLRRSKPPR